MTSTAIELSPAELAMIEAKRAEEQAKKDQQAAAEALREEKIRKAKEDRKNAELAMIANLREADTDNILFQTAKGGDCLIFYMVGDRDFAVTIREHNVYRSGSWRGTSQGLKYQLGHTYDDRYYKNPKTVIKKIKEAQEEHEEERRRNSAIVKLKVDAGAELKKKYPKCNVTFVPGQERTKWSSYRPNRYIVESDNGSVEFTYGSETEDGHQRIVFRINAYQPAESIEKQVAELILG